MSEAILKLQDTLKWVKDRRAHESAVLAERERCAKIAESMDSDFWSNDDIAARIRGTSNP